MDSNGAMSMRERVRETRNRKIPDRLHDTPTSTRLSTPRSSQKKTKTQRKTPKGPKKVKQGADGYWGIKRIVKQEYREETIGHSAGSWYLVDWEDDERTGEVFPHQWVGGRKRI